ncbi:MAG: hypothetical protein J6Z36_03620 [Clostridia bacterium]|nr:hypothetical protein [Clostridia bacterium]
MSKTKSVVCTVLIAIVIVLLSLMCVLPEFSLPFSVGGEYKKYNSVVNAISYGSDLGGGYSAVYYPEGVISAAEYNQTVTSYQAIIDDAEVKGDAKTKADYEYAKTEYEGKYIAYNTAKFGENAPKNAVLYLENNKVCFKNADDSYSVGEEFSKQFDLAVSVFASRFDKKNFSFLTVAKTDDFTITVSVPLTVEDADNLFSVMGYTGEFTLRSADQTLLKTYGGKKTTDYFKSASDTTSNGEGAVVLNFTKDGREKVKTYTTAVASDSDDASIYFYVGETQALEISLGGSAIDSSQIAVPGSFTPDAAQTMGIVIDSAIKNQDLDWTFTVSSTQEYAVGAATASKTGIFIVFGVAILAMLIFTFVRYKGLGIAHLFGYLSYLICMLMFMAYITGMVVTPGGILAVALTSITLAVSNYYVFENVRKEFATGKTLEASIGAGYKRSLAALLDGHILLLAASLITYFVGVGELTTFAFIFGLGVLMSGITSVLLTRFYWYVTRGLVARGQQYKFCGFKREVTDDDEDE